MKKKPNRTMYSLPLSPEDRDYLHLLITTDLARLKGSGERALRSRGYMIQHKLGTLILAKGGKTDGHRP